MQMQLDLADRTLATSMHIKPPYMLFVFHSESCPESTNINTAAESMGARASRKLVCMFRRSRNAK
jgi:hypothetical protein